MNVGTETLFTGETRFTSFIPSTPSTVVRGAYFDRLMNELVVNFTNGHSYKLLGVSEDVYEQFKQAPSHGSFFNKMLKKTYQAVKLA